MLLLFVGLTEHVDALVREAQVDSRADGEINQVAGDGMGGLEGNNGLKGGQRYA